MYKGFFSQPRNCVAESSLGKNFVWLRVQYEIVLPEECCMARINILQEVHCCKDGPIWSVTIC